MEKGTIKNRILNIIMSIIMMFTLLGVNVNAEVDTAAALDWPSGYITSEKVEYKNQTTGTEWVDISTVTDIAGTSHPHYFRGRFDFQIPNTVTINNDVTYKYDLSFLQNAGFQLKQGTAASGTLTNAANQELGTYEIKGSVVYITLLSEKLSGLSEIKGFFMYELDCKRVENTITFPVSGQSVTIDWADSVLNKLNVRKQFSSFDYQTGTIQYLLTCDVGNSGGSNIVLTDQLGEGLSYEGSWVRWQTGTTTWTDYTLPNAACPVTATISADKRTVTYTAANVPSNGKISIKLSAKVNNYDTVYYVNGSSNDVVKHFTNDLNYNSKEFPTVQSVPQIDTKLEKHWINKTASYDKDNKKIDWKVVVNDGDKYPIKGFVLDDDGGTNVTIPDDLNVTLSYINADDGTTVVDTETITGKQLKDGYTITKDHLGKVIVEYSTIVNPELYKKIGTTQFANAFMIKWPTGGLYLSGGIEVGYALRPSISKELTTDRNTLDYMDPTVTEHRVDWHSYFLVTDDTAQNYTYHDTFNKITVDGVEYKQTFKQDTLVVKKKTGDINLNTGDVDEGAAYTLIKGTDYTVQETTNGFDVIFTNELSNDGHTYVQYDLTYGSTYEFNPYGSSDVKDTFINECWLNDDGAHALDYFEVVRHCILDKVVVTGKFHAIENTAYSKDQTLTYKLLVNKNFDDTLNGKTVQIVDDLPEGTSFIDVVSCYQVPYDDRTHDTSSSYQVNIGDHFTYSYDKATNKLTFTAKEDETFTRHDSRSDTDKVCEYVIFYRIKVSTDLIKQGLETGTTGQLNTKKIPIANTAKAFVNNTFANSASTNTDYYIESGVKYSEEVADIASGKIVRYSIRFNEKRENLDQASEYLTVSDTLNERFEPYYGTDNEYKFICYSESKDRYYEDFYSYDSITKTLTFTVPDETDILIQFYVILNGKLGEQYTIRNDANISGTTVSDNSNFKWTVSGGIEGTSTQLKIHKTSTDGQTSLAGAKFDLYKVTFNDDGTVTDTVIKTGLTTGADGKCIYPETTPSVDDLRADTLYYLLETDAPAGYKKSTARVYFYEPGNAEATVKAKINAAITNGKLDTGARTLNRLTSYKEITNEISESPTLTIKKIKAGDSSTVLSGSKFDLYQVDLESGTETKVDTLDGSTNGVMSRANLSVNSLYYVVEVKAPEGYELSSTKTYFFQDGADKAAAMAAKEKAEDRVPTGTILHKMSSIVEIENVPVTNKGNLSLTKKVENHTVDADETYYFTITNGEGEAIRYYNTDNLSGSSDKITQEVVIRRNTTENTVTLNNIPVGNYTITETTAAGEVLTSTAYTVSGTGTVEVKVNETKSVTVKNTFPGKGNLKVEKVISGKTFTTDKTYYFTVTSGTGSDLKYYTVENTAGSSDIATQTVVVAANGTSNAVTMSNIPVGTYTVTEVKDSNGTPLGDSEGYTVSYEGGKDVVVTGGNTGSKKVTNSYSSDYGNLKLIKHESYTAGELENPFERTYYFTVQNQDNNKYYTSTDSAGKTDAKEAVQAITFTGTETYNKTAQGDYYAQEVTLTDIPCGTYVVREVEVTLEGGQVKEITDLGDGDDDWRISGQGSTGTVVKTQTAEITLYNVIEGGKGSGAPETPTINDPYTGKLHITKTVTGRDTGYTHTYYFTVQGNTDHKYYYLNAVKGSDELKTVALNWSESSKTVLIQNLVPQTYTVTETDADGNPLTNNLNGLSVSYKVAVSAEFTNGVSGTVNVPESGTANVIAGYEVKNSYDTEANIAVNKVVEGVGAPTETFNITLTPENASNPMPAETTADIQDGETATFGPISFNKAGTYAYKVTETAGTTDGMTYSTQEIIATVEVTETATGALTAAVTYTGGDGENNNTITNGYTGSGLTIKKKVVDQSNKTITGTLSNNKEYQVSVVKDSKYYTVDASGAVVVSDTEAWNTITTTKSVTFTTLPAGDYTITEKTGNIAAIDGYIFVSNETKVKYPSKTETSNVVTITTGAGVEATITNKYKVVSVEITKQDQLGAAITDMTGAKFSILDDQNKVVKGLLNNGTKLENLTWEPTTNVTTIGALKVGKVYTFREVSAPEGYETLVQDVKFTIDVNGVMTTVNAGKHTDAAGNEYDEATNNTQTGGANKLSVVNVPTHVTIRKVDITNEDELPGAKLEILDESNVVVKSWVSTTDPKLITGLKTGIVYTLRETVAPAGYELTTDTKFALKADGTIDTAKTTASVTNGAILVKDTMTSVKVLKTDIASDAALSGAKFTIYRVSEGGTKTVAKAHINGAVALTDAEWTSTDTEVEISGLETGTYDGGVFTPITYKLIETVAPAGYELVSEEITFKLNEYGNIASLKSGKKSGKDEASLIAIDSIMVSDKQTEVSVLKIDASTGKALENATLQILDQDGKVVTINGTKLEWQSGTTAKKIKGLKTGVTYTLKETAAPNGYGITASTTFTLKADGTIDTANTTTTVTEGVLNVKDELTEVTITKIAKDTGKALKGAKLSIQDADGKEIEQWVTDGEAHKITGKLIAGNKYILVELSAPSGYNKAANVVFNVPNDGKITVEMVDPKQSPSGGSGGIVPNTGDNTPIILYAVGLISAIVILAIMFIKKRKQA